MIDICAFDKVNSEEGEEKKTPNVHFYSLAWKTSRCVRTPSGRRCDADGSGQKEATRLSSRGATGDLGLR